MPSPQFIFYSCDEHKSTKSKQAKFIFQDSHYNKVLRHIEANLDDYFDGSTQRKKDSFNRVYDMVKLDGIEISKVINIVGDLFAYCEEIDTIIHIQH